MIVGTSAPSNALLDRLKANGLSSAKADRVQADLQAAVKDAAGAAGTTPDRAAVRAALDKRIAADVASGKLSKTDAAEVSKALDQMDAQAQGASTATGKAGGSQRGAPAGGGGGGGGGGSATKTELSRIVTVAGTIKTTIITYTDGTSATTTSAATASDETRYGKHQDDTAQPNVANDYLATISPGSLLDAEA